MDLTISLAVLTRYLRLIVVVTILTALVAYGGSYLFSPSYSATTKVLVRAREARFLTSSGQDLSRQPGVIDSSLAKSLGQTNAGLVKSRDVAERIVRDLGLDGTRPEDTSILGALRSAMKKTYNVVKAIVAHGFYTEPTSQFEAAVIDVQNQLQATPLKDSYLIEIKASADNPKLAAGIADAAAASLVSVNKDRFEKDANAYRDFLQLQVDRARADVQAADQAIRAYKDANGITIVGEQLKLSASSQESIRQALHQTEVDLDGATAKQSAIERSLANVSSTESTTTTVQSGRSATTTTATAPNKLYQDLQRDLSAVKAQIASLKAQRETLAASLVTPANNTGVLPTQEAKLNELELTLSTSQAAYRSVRQSYDEAILNSAKGADEVSQVDHATVPLYPDRPVRWMFALLGLVLGAVAGVALAYLLDRRAVGAVVPDDLPPTRPPQPSRTPAPLSERALLGPAGPNRSDLEPLKDGAAMMIQAGNRVAAMALLWCAVAIDPTDLASHRRLAATLAHGGDIDGAADEYARYIEFMLPLGEVGRATMELSYGARMLGSHPALHEAAEKIVMASRATAPRGPFHIQEHGR